MPYGVLVGKIVLEDGEHFVKFSLKGSYGVVSVFRDRGVSDGTR
jgi:hypothetical protein